MQIHKLTMLFLFLSLSLSFIFVANLLYDSLCLSVRNAIGKNNLDSYNWILKGYMIVSDISNASNKIVEGEGVDFLWRGGDNLCKNSYNPLKTTLMENHLIG